MFHVKHRIIQQEIKIVQLKIFILPISQNISQEIIKIIKHMIKTKSIIFLNLN